MENPFPVYTEREMDFLHNKITIFVLISYDAKNVPVLVRKRETWYIKNDLA